MINFPLTKKQINIIKNFGNSPCQAIPNMNGFTEINIYNEYFKKYNFKNKNILELGPGQCQFLRLFKNNNNNLFGIDLDPFVKELGDTLNIEIDNCNGYTNSKLLNNNTKYDVIFSFTSVDYDSTFNENFLKKLDDCVNKNSIILHIPWFSNIPINIKDKEDLLKKFNYEIIKLDNLKYTHTAYQFNNEKIYGYILIKNTMGLD